MATDVTDHEHEDDTIAAPDDVGTEVEPAKKADGLLEYDPEVWSKPPKKCPKTGRFIAGTGGSKKGGRPKGSKDKISVQFLQIMEAVIEEQGADMMRRLAEENPAAALAIISRSLPAKAMQDAIDESNKGEDGPITVTINLAPANPKAQLERDKVERLSHLSEDDKDFIRGVVEENVTAPTEMAEEFPPIDMNAPPRPRERPPQPRSDGGYKRGGSASDTIDYFDDNVV